MSTPGPERVPSTVKVGKTSGQGKPPAGGSKPAAAKPARRPAERPGGKGKGRKPVTPVKVSGGRNWGPIIVGGVVGVVVARHHRLRVFAVVRGSRSWEDKAADIKGIVNYRAQKNPQLDAREPQGRHADVRDQPAGRRRAQPAVAELHGRRLRPRRSPTSTRCTASSTARSGSRTSRASRSDQVDVLKKKVEGKDYMFMSPVPGPRPQRLPAGLGLPAQGRQRQRPAHRRVHQGRCG